MHILEGKGPEVGLEVLPTQLVEGALEVHAGHLVLLLHLEVNDASADVLCGTEVVGDQLPGVDLGSGCPSELQVTNNALGLALLVQVGGDGLVQVLLGEILEGHEVPVAQGDHNLKVVHWCKCLGLLQEGMGAPLRVPVPEDPVGLGANPGHNLWILQVLLGQDHSLSKVGSLAGLLLAPLLVVLDAVVLELVQGLQGLGLPIEATHHCQARGNKVAPVDHLLISEVLVDPAVGDLKQEHASPIPVEHVAGSHHGPHVLQELPELTGCPVGFLDGALQELNVPSLRVMGVCTQCCHDVIAVNAVMLSLLSLLSMLSLQSLWVASMLSCLPWLPLLRLDLGVR